MATKIATKNLRLDSKLPRSAHNRDSESSSRVFEVPPAAAAGDSRNLNSEVGPESKREFRPLHSSGLNKTAAGPGYEVKERYLPFTLCLVLVVTRKSILLTGSER